MSEHMTERTRAPRSQNAKRMRRRAAELAMQQETRARETRRARKKEIRRVRDEELRAMVLQQRSGEIRQKVGFVDCVKCYSPYLNFVLPLSTSVTNKSEIGSDLNTTNNV